MYHQTVLPFLDCDGLIETEPIAWTDEEVVALRDALLVDAIRSLFDSRQTEAYRQEILAWMLSDAVGAFTYRVCCRDAGVDPDALRETLQARMARSRAERSTAMIGDTCERGDDSFPWRSPVT